MDEEALQVAAAVTGVLTRLGIPYCVGGSLASSLHGHPRSTNDVDIVADIRTDQIGDLATALEDDFYIEPEAVADAIARSASFNVIHSEKFVKLDIFVCGKQAFRRRELERATTEEILGFRFSVASPEDTILAKLAWFRDGGETSERQWRDVLGVILVQGDRLDMTYLNETAPTLGVADLLENALAEAQT